MKFNGKYYIVSQPPGSAVYQLIQSYVPPSTSIDEVYVMLNNDVFVNYSHPFYSLYTSVEKPLVIYTRFGKFFYQHKLVFRLKVQVHMLLIDTQCSILYSWFFSYQKYLF